MRLVEIGAPLVLSEIPAPDSSMENTVVSLNYAALNRRDYWVQQGQYPGIDIPVTLGSDGAGVENGREVVINPGLNWGNSQRFQGPDFHILGMPQDGTLAEQVLVSKAQVFPKPPHLSIEEAAALPLAGVTAYRALFVHGQPEPASSILITGIGGGVALTAMQFALSHQMKVYVTSSDANKRSLAENLGASGSENYRDPEWAKSLKAKAGLFDLILDSAGGKDFGALQTLVKPGGKIVVYGGTQGKIQDLSPQILYWRQTTIQGSTMGSPKDFADMLKFVTQHKILPVIDSVFELEDTNTAIDKLKESKQFGKIVIRIS